MGYSGVRSGRTVSGFIVAFLIAGLAFAAQDQHIDQKLAALGKLPSKFSFVVLGDTRTGDAVYRKVIAAAVGRKPDLIVNTGDQIAQPGDREQWQRFWEMSKSAVMPYFLTVGNHDVSPRVPGSEALYRDEVDLPGNELYYSFTAGNALFIVLDSCLPGAEQRITGEQLRWLEGTLGAAKQKPVFVFVHHPLFPEPGKGRHVGSSLDRYPAERDRLHALFKKYAVAAVFQGHEHVYLRQDIDGVLYITAGGGGAPLYAGDEDGGFYHYVHVTVNGGLVTGETVDLDGNVRDTFVIRSAEVGVRSKGRKEP